MIWRFVSARKFHLLIIFSYSNYCSNYKSGGDGGDEKKVFVKGFDSSLSEDDIRNALTEHFSSCGEVKTVSVPMDRETGNSKGFVIFTLS